MLRSYIGLFEMDGCRVLMRHHWSQDGADVADMRRVA